MAKEKEKDEKNSEKSQGKAQGDAGEVTGTEVEFIMVRSPRDDNRVAFSEQHPHHPNGEAFVYGDKPVRVAKTSEVLRALNDKRIEEVTGKEAKAAKSEETK